MREGQCKTMVEGRSSPGFLRLDPMGLVVVEGVEVEKTEEGQLMLIGWGTIFQHGSPIPGCLWPGLVG